MPSVIIIEKNASIKSHNIKVFSEDDLYKKVGFKTKDGFSRQTTWNVEVDKTAYSIELYAKTTGRAGQENKYDFPPPVDKTLFFGGCVLVRRKGDEVVNLTEKEWEKIYEHLFGGFEDIGDEDSEYESEDDLSADVPVTKNGYVKDGFVVDDDDEEDDDYSSEEEVRQVVKKTPKPKTVKKSDPRSIDPRSIDPRSIEQQSTEKQSTKEVALKPAKSKSKSNAVAIHPEENVKIIMDTTTTTPTVEDATYLGCTNELEEEPYV
jgi:hypothetical protein